MLNKRILKGNFDEESLTFSSSEVLFAQDYDIMLREFEKTVNSYNHIFNLEFHKIKKILTKSNENIFPQEIKKIQELIDRINEKYVRWNRRGFIDGSGTFQRIPGCVQGFESQHLGVHGQLLYPDHG